MAQGKDAWLILVSLGFPALSRPWASCPGDAGNLSKTFPATNVSTEQRAVITPDGLSFRLAPPLTRTGWFVEERLRSGIWEPRMAPWIREVLQSDPRCTRPLFLDLGAAFGYYSLQSDSCRVVHAFNPHPIFASFMRLNVRDNLKRRSILNQQVCVNELALASDSGAGMT